MIRRFFRWIAPPGDFECSLCLTQKPVDCPFAYRDGVCGECKRVLGRHQAKSDRPAWRPRVCA